MLSYKERMRDVTITEEVPTLDDVTELVPASDGRAYNVTVRELRVFTLRVVAGTEEEAIDAAYEMEWPDPTLTIKQQECEAREFEYASAQ